MAHATVNRSDREDHFRFLDLPAELRNRIYDFAVETGANHPRCVLPCLALAQSCQQLRTEYRSICLKRDIIIDWKAVTGYLRSFFPTVNGKIENVELAPASMTIVTPWCGDAKGDGHELDLLPLVKLGLQRPNFTCCLIHDPASLDEEEKLSQEHDFRSYIEEDSTALEKMMCSQNPHWLSDIEAGVITKLMTSNIGVSDSPQAAFYMKTPSLAFETFDEDNEEDSFEGTYFANIGVDAAWGEFREFSTFPELLFDTSEFFT